MRACGKKARPTTCGREEPERVAALMLTIESVLTAWKVCEEVFELILFSNGGGRSGAFLALDANLELMKKTGQLDVYEYAKTLVNSRPHLIDSVDQYQFIYEALAEVSNENFFPSRVNDFFPSGVDELL